jgi:hypothetical protein
MGFNYMYTGVFQRTALGVFQRLPDLCRGVSAGTNRLNSGQNGRFSGCGPPTRGISALIVRIITGWLWKTVKAVIVLGRLMAGKGVFQGILLERSS